MSDPSAEFPKPPHREIHIGEEFFPFDVKFTERRPENIYGHYFGSSRALLLPKISLDFSFEAGVSGAFNPEKDHVFTPFNPEIGSVLRGSSLQRGQGDEISELNEDQRVFKHAPFTFGISFEKLTSGKEEYDKLKEATDDIHLQVFFPLVKSHSGIETPGGQFETFGILPQFGDEPHKWSSFWIVMGEDFHPLRQGPLSEAEDGGIPIFLPDDLEKLAQIRAKFVMHPNLDSNQSNQV